MISTLMLIPLLIVLSILVVYRFNGRKEFLKLDLVQFFYMYVIAPLLFIWGKSFLYFILRNEIEIRLSAGQIFVYDTFFSLIFLYLYSFVVMHSLTKTFKEKYLRDPLYDMLLHSEYIHLWMSHLFMYVGAMLVITLLAIINAVFPLTIDMSRVVFLALVSSGWLAGLLCYIGIVLSDPLQEQANFLRLMKLSFGFCFTLLVGFYFLVEPKFNQATILYWWTTFGFASLVSISFFTYRSSRAKNGISNLADRLKHLGWGNNPQLFNSHKK